MSIKKYQHTNILQNFLCKVNKKTLSHIFSLKTDLTQNSFHPTNSIVQRLRYKINSKLLSLFSTPMKILMLVIKPRQLMQSKLPVCFIFNLYYFPLRASVSLCFHFLLFFYIIISSMLTSNPSKSFDLALSPVPHLPNRL